MIVLGRTAGGDPVTVGDEDAALVLGPPRSGKTSRIVIPTAMTHRGPMIVTSSKLDVARATLEHRMAVGPVWVMAPRNLQVPDGVRLATWNPVPVCVDLDAAILHAHGMVGATIRHGESGGDDRFWYRQAERVLGAMFHAAALDGRHMGHVAAWALTGDLGEPVEILRTAQAGWAMSILSTVQRANDRFRDSVMSTASDVMRVYDLTQVRAHAGDEPFSIDEFLDRDGTLYIVADAQHMDAMSPLVVGLIEDVLRHRFRRGAGRGRTLLCLLDELARISPIRDLPGWLAEAGSQGVQVLGVLQDLSQARDRWGADAAQGFLTLFTDLVLLRGVRDRALLDDLSALLGEDMWSPSPGTLQPRPTWSLPSLAAPDPGTAIHARGATASTILLDSPGGQP